MTQPSPVRLQAPPAACPKCGGAIHKQPSVTQAQLQIAVCERGCWGAVIDPHPPFTWEPTPPTVSPPSEPHPTDGGR